MPLMPLMLKPPSGGRSTALVAALVAAAAFGASLPARAAALFDCPMDAVSAELAKSSATAAGTGAGTAAGTAATLPCAQERYKPAEDAGQLKALVLFVKFSDDATALPCADPSLGVYAWPAESTALPAWSDSLLARTAEDAVTPGRFGYGGLTHYFFDNSGGQYALYGDVYPTLVVSPNPSGYYTGAKDWALLNNQILRQIDTAPIDAARPNGIDFSEYDQFPQDGYVDMVIMVVRTYPNAATKASIANGTWKGIAWLWAPAQCGLEIVTNDSATVAGSRVPIRIGGTSGITCEIDGAMSQVELMAHEVGHQILGTETGFKQHETHLGGYSIMDGGHLVSASDRERLGWAPIREITGTEMGVLIDPIRDGERPGTIVKVPLDGQTPSKEFLLVENRQGHSLWEKSQANAPEPRVRCGYPDWTGYGGLLVTHVKEDDLLWRTVRVESAEGAFDLKPNLNSNFQRPNPVSGASALDAQIAYLGEPRPGASGHSFDFYSPETGTVLAPYTVPNTNLWAGSGPAKGAPTGIAMINVRRGNDPTGVLAADFVAGAPASEINVPTTWSGWVTLGRDVTVSAGGSLSALPGTTVIAPIGLDFGAAGLDPGRVEIVSDGGTILGEPSPTAGARFVSSAIPDIAARFGSGIDFTPTPFDWAGIRCGSAGNILIAGARIESAVEGVHVAGGVADVRGSAIAGCATGVLVTGGAAYLGTDVVTDCTTDGVSIRNVSATLSGCTIEDAGVADLRVLWYSGVPAPVILIDKCTLRGGEYGLLVDPASRNVPAHLRVTNSAFEGSRIAATRAANNSGRVIFRRNTVDGDSVGFIVAPGAVGADLGAFGTPGGNCFAPGLDLFVMSNSAVFTTARGNYWGTLVPSVAKFEGAVDYGAAQAACPTTVWAGDMTTGVESAPAPGAPEARVTVRPNPTRGPATVTYRIARDTGGGAGAMIDLALFDASGRRVRTFVAGAPIARSRAPVEGSADWDGADDEGRPLAAGIYFLRLRAAGAPDGYEKVTLVR